MNLGFLVLKTGLFYNYYWIELEDCNRLIERVSVTKYWLSVLVLTLDPEDLRPVLERWRTKTELSGFHKWPLLF